MHHILYIYIITVPDINWKGNAVLDFESWTTVWDLNIGEGTWHSKIYQNYSIQLMKKQYPTLNETEIYTKAKQHGSEFLDSVAVSYVVYDHPTGMNVAAVPDSIKEQYLDHYFTLPIDVAKRMQPYIKLLEETEHNPTTTKVLMNRMRNRDQIRDTNLLELWPEWEPYYGG